MSRVPRLRRTLGTEFELQHVNLHKPDPNNPFDPPIYNRSALVGATFGKSRFRTLFAFFGRTPAGQWEKHVLPREVAEHDSVEELVREGRLSLRKTTEGYRVEGWETIDPAVALDVVRGILNARGRSSTTVELRKDKAAWDNLPVQWQGFEQKYDDLIPDRVAEEWRVGQGLVNLEFPMRGSVQSGRELQLFFVNLWMRLGFFNNRMMSVFGDAEPPMRRALEKVEAEVHWVPKIGELPRGWRKPVYAATIGYWGDINDAHLAHVFNYFLPPKENGRSLSITKHRVQGICEHLGGLMSHYSKAILTREMYQRVTPTADGLEVEGRTNDIDLSADPNLPASFKRLYFGLRGRYGPIVGPRDPVTIIGLESSGMVTLGKNLNALPKKAKHQPEVDVDELLTHQSPRARGVIGSSLGLKRAAAELSVDERLIDEYDACFSAPAREGMWDPGQVRAMHFIGLNDWLSHPLVQRNLERLTSGNRTEVIQRYQAARHRYLARLCDLAHARINPGAPYHPDWDWNIVPDRETQNVMRPSNGGRTSSEQSWTLGPSQLLSAILLVEGGRFVTESKLADMVKMPPHVPAMDAALD